jgi:hypothetical protein
MTASFNVASILTVKEQNPTPDAIQKSCLVDLDGILMIEGRNERVLAKYDPCLLLYLLCRLAVQPYG